MNNAVRRRLAVGALTVSGALVASLVVAPSAFAGNLVITPAGAENTESAKVLTFAGTDAQFAFGGSATFTRTVPGSATFTVAIAPTMSPSDRGQGTADLTDGGDGLQSDGPVPAGIYNVTASGRSPITTDGPSGTDSCTTCFEVTSPGPVDLNSVAPSSQRPGASARTTFSGNNFAAGATLRFFRAGLEDGTVTANELPEATQQNPVAPGTELQTDDITTRTQLIRQLRVAGGALPGARDVLVTNVDGTSDTCVSCFFVAGLDLTAVSDPSEPNDPGQPDKALTFSGTSIAAGTMRLEYLGPVNGTTREALTLVATGSTRNATNSTITGSFNFSNAAPGTYQPVVRAPDGTVNACTCRFSVLQPAARDLDVTRLERSDAVVGSGQPAGTTRTFDVTGTGFSKGVNVVVSGSGITTVAVEFVSPTLIKVTLASTPAAATGVRDVTVTLADGSQTDTCTGCYNVTAAGSEGSATATTTIFTRLSGNDRYATAAAIATASFSDSATTVLLANGQNDDPATANRNENHFPDALAGAYLAGNRTAPTLLATETSVPASTTQALQTLKTRNIVIIGGTSAISSGVEQSLRSQGFAVSRVSGPTRYDTARAVALNPGASYVGTVNGERVAIVANGQNFPDALVSGPLAYRSRIPVLITTPGSLSSQTRTALQELDIDRVLVVGGTTAVSQSTEDQIKALNIATTRLSGPDKTATAVAIAKYAYGTLAFDAAHINLARGDAFPDALAGGPHGGRENAPIVLTASATQVGTPTLTFLQERGRTLRSGHIFGGTAAVSPSAERDAEAAVARGR